MTTDEMIEILEVQASDYECVGQMKNASEFMQIARKMRKLQNEAHRWQTLAESLARAVMTDAIAQGV